jgi:hypothetical protein
MTVFVLCKKRGYFAGKAKVKTRNFEECLGARKTFTVVQEAAPNASLQACALRLPKIVADALPFRFPGPFCHTLRNHY